MDKEQKLFFGKILGEIYRLQRANQDVSCPASSAQIYALLNGFEHAVEHELEMIGQITDEQLKAVIDVLDPIWLDKEKIDNFKGFYDIERDLKNNVKNGSSLDLTYEPYYLIIRTISRGKSLTESINPPKCITLVAQFKTNLAEMAKRK